MKKILVVLFCLFSITHFTFAQQDSIIDYSIQQKYEVGGVKVRGARYSDDNAIIAISGLYVGQKIQVPGGDISKAINALWRLDLFTDVQVFADQIGDVLMLTIQVEERPRLSRHTYRGVKKGLHDDLNSRVNRHLRKGSIVTENMKTNAANAIEGYMIEKGFLDAEVTVMELADTIIPNAARLVFDIDKKKRVKIHDVRFSGVEKVKVKKLRKLMKETRRKRHFFSISKYIKHEYKNDKDKIIAYYNKLGHRDAKIVSDSVYRKDGRIMIDIDIQEGNQYYFRDINWVGNTIYTKKQLETALGIVKGDIYNKELLESRLRFSPDGRDISSLYLDDGYLFFRLEPVEQNIENDSIDLEIRLFEGTQATIGQVIIKGNDRTHEHVIRRSLRTRPGEKFSRSAIIRSQREIVNLGFFNPEALGVNTPVNPQRGTVDIEYTVEEKPSDQLELSAGWGGRGRGVIGTLGVTFSNFSLRNLGNKEAWSPLPQGDGQRLSLRAQTNGKFFQSYNISLTEPWLGGKKPNAFTVAAVHSRYSNGLSKSSEGYSLLTISSVSVGLGTRLKVPDDFFISNTTLTYQNIHLNNRFNTFSNVTDGNFNSLSLKQTIARNSIDQPIFPRSGSRISLTGEFTLPYSLFQPNRDFASETADKKFRWVEYHKWRFDAEWYVPLFNKMVLKASAKIGAIGAYNNDIGLSPFERFELGGDGISNQGGLEGKDIISMRGYDVADLEANGDGGAGIYDKFTLELRYPLSLNPSSTIYVLGFLQGGNAWNNFRDFNPLDLRKSAGVGLRVFLPMFGTLGFDYGVGFDKDLPAGSRIGEYGRFNIILGFEPE